MISPTGETHAPNPQSEIQRDLIAELVELRKQQDAKWPPGHVPRLAAFQWVELALSQIDSASNAPESSPAFRRRLIRATSYLLAALESTDHRNEKFLRRFGRLLRHFHRNGAAVERSSS
ncbi:hypothetical protein SAMN05444166_6268 [Singulisphaera sp. GP187]|uniref:hypothetical protein n=1 Tax=Singulisphaera sp. GP187 TaxID=1882752 RepID=UPI0009288327|nr:hypothetical protein [Singulisphaera sp. GP187]SIO60104.1 hypothetical protein SAMN05444166_6268 [Singulisphaera sp. GP187]